jgi:hypothetical protein
MAAVNTMPTRADGVQREPFDWLFSEFGAHDPILLAGGGSPALVWAARSATGEPIVIKFLDAAAGLVDGHDLPTFRLKPRQIAHVHARAPGISPWYVRVIGEWHGQGMAAYAMPHYCGEPVSNALNGQVADIPGFLATLRKVLLTLTDEGYTAAEWPGDVAYFHRRYLHRVWRRLPLLRSHLDHNLLDGAGGWINGRRRPSLTQLLSRLAGDHDLVSRIAPARLHFPLHGDLNLGNLLVRADGFTVVDPRGTLSPWDSVYDMAKIVFSLTVFESAMAGGFEIARRTAADGVPFYRLELRHPRPASLAAASALPAMLDGLPFFRHLDHVDAGWRQRLAFAHALHCLAEAACRLSDRKPLCLPGGPQGWAACLELANGLLLTGICVLDDVLAAQPRLTPTALCEIADPVGAALEPSAGRPV